MNKEWLKEKLESGIPDLSLYNCHAKGLHSLALNRIENSEGNKSFFARIFYADHYEHGLDRLFDDDDNFNIAVHNHRYDIVLQPLVGTLGNYTVLLDGHQNILGPIFEFGYISALLNGDAKIEFKEQHKGWVSRTEYLSPQDKKFMFAEELHTVIVPKSTSKFSAWLVLEFADRINSKFYSLSTYPSLNTSDMYQPMAVDVAEKFVEEIISEMP